MAKQHMSIEALDPAGGYARRWRCRYCKAAGTVDELDAIDCTHVYPACDDCGQTPECAPDCKGVARALSTAGVRVLRHYERPAIVLDEPMETSSLACSGGKATAAASCTPVFTS